MLKFILSGLLISQLSFAAFLGKPVKVVNGGTGATSVTSLSGLVESISGDVETVANKVYVLDQYASYAYTINTLKIITASGTVTAAVKINGTAVTGISAVSVSSTIATGTASAANTVAIGDRVTLETSSNSTALDMAFTLKVTR